MGWGGLRSGGVSQCDLATACESGLRFQAVGRCRNPPRLPACQTLHSLTSPLMSKITTFGELSASALKTMMAAVCKQKSMYEECERERGR